MWRCVAAGGREGVGADGRYWRLAADLPYYGRSVVGDGRHEVPVWSGVERPRAGREGVGAGGGIRGRRLAYRVAAGVLEWAICDGRYVAMCG